MITNCRPIFFRLKINRIVAALGACISKKKAEYQKSNHEHFLNEKRLSNHTQTQDLYIFIKINDKHVLSKENLLQITKKKNQNQG